MFEDALASKVKLICKKREEIIDEFEKGFEGDDFLKLDFDFSKLFCNFLNRRYKLNHKV